MTALKKIIFEYLIFLKNYNKLIKFEYSLLEIESKILEYLYESKTALSRKHEPEADSKTLNVNME